MKKIAIQYITYWSEQARKDIDKACESLLDLYLGDLEVHFIMIDNPSPRGRANDYLRKKWFKQLKQHFADVTIIENEVNNGFAGGHNNGYQVAKKWRADAIYLLNQDAWMHEDALDESVKQMVNDENIAQVQSLILLDQDHTKVNSIGNCLTFLGVGYADGEGKDLSSAKKAGLKHFYSSGAGTLIRCSAIEAAGGLFDTDFFMYHEDVDISWRLRLAGFDIGFSEASIIYHRYEKKRSMKLFYFMERNRHLVNLSHYRLLTLILIAPMMIVMESGSFLFALKSGYAKDKIRSWKFFLKKDTWNWIVKRRKSSKNIRQISDGEILDQMTANLPFLLWPWMTIIVNVLMRLYFWAVRGIIFW